MNNDSLDWQHVASAARRAAENDPSEPSRPLNPALESRLVRKIAAQAMRSASLNAPSAGSVLVAWLAYWKIWILIGILGASLLTPIVSRSLQPSREVRIHYWTLGTLRQLRAWHPMSCEEAGAFNIRMQDAARQIQNLRPGSPQSELIFQHTIEAIATELSPTEKSAFLLEQDRLRKRWLRDL